MSEIALPGKPGRSKTYGALTITARESSGAIEVCEVCSLSGRFMFRLAGHDMLTERVRAQRVAAKFCRKHALEMTEAYISAREEQQSE